MKKLLISCVLMTVPALAQSVVRFDSNVTTTASNVPLNASAAVLTVPNAIVSVCGFPAVGSPCTNTVNVFFDQAMTQPLDNPLRTDAKGRFGFWIPSGNYHISYQNMNGVIVGEYDKTLLQGASGLAIVSVPAGGQTITQPAGTTFTPNSMDNVLYADMFPGSDIGAKINAAAAVLPIGHSGYKTGTIMLPQSNGGAWTTTVHLGPGTNLIGQGKFASMFSCSVAGDCLIHDASASSGIFAHTVESNTRYSGFTITGTGASGQNIFHLKDAQGLYVSDAVFDGASEAGGACVLFHDVNLFTERDTFMDVSTGFGCAIGWRFISDAGNPFQPHPSFGYNRMLDIKANPNNGQTAFSFEGNSFIFNSTYNITVNSDGSGNNVFHMQDGAEFFFNDLHLDGEQSSAGTATVFDITSAGNQFTYSGSFIFGGASTSNVVAGAVVTHWLDSGGFSPPITNATQFAISSTQAQQIGTGTDLNNVTQCGKYEGSASTNTPLVIGSQFYRLDVVCGGTIGGQSYVTQIIYAAQFTFGANKVFFRVRDNGVWYPWKQIGFTTDSPTAGVTGALPGAAISAGSCSNLATVINNGTGAMAVAATPNSQTQLISGLHWDTAYISATNGPLMFANDPAGTSTNHLVKQAANGTVLTTAVSDIGGILGPCTAGCGTTGTATIATGGTASLVYDGATTSGDFIINSTTIPGAAHDFGPSPTGATSQILGQVLSTNGSAGTYATALTTGYPASVTVTVPVCNTTSGSITPNITPTFNVRLIP